MPGPAARPSLGAGRPGNQSLESAEEHPWARFKATDTDRPAQLVTGCPYSRLKVASELARMVANESPLSARSGGNASARLTVPASTNPYRQEGSPLFIGAII